jgi:hypothetical protein
LLSRETKDAYVVEAELPGVRRDDVQVEASDGVLSITGEFKERERTGILRRRTGRTGRFEFRTTLPTVVDSEGITASLHEGVLTVKVPKAEQAKPRRVEPDEEVQALVTASAGWTTQTMSGQKGWITNWTLRLVPLSSDLDTE